MRRGQVYRFALRRLDSVVLCLDAVMDLLW